MAHEGPMSQADHPHSRRPGQRESSPGAQSHSQGGAPLQSPALYAAHSHLPAALQGQLGSARQVKTLRRSDGAASTYPVSNGDESPGVQVPGGSVGGNRPHEPQREPHLFPGRRSKPARPWGRGGGGGAGDRGTPPQSLSTVGVTQEPGPCWPTPEVEGGAGADT